MLVLPALATAQTVVDFDNPQPPLYPATVGLYKDLDWEGEWSAAAPSGPVLETSIWFASNDNGPHAFARQTGPAVLSSFDVYGAAGSITLTITDDQGQAIQCIAPADTKATCATGWTQAGTTFIVTTDNGWNFNLVRLVFNAPAGSPPDSSSDVTITISGAALASAMLVWDAGAESDLAGYRVYQSTTQGSYGAALAEVVEPVYISNDLAPGTYYWVVTAFDQSNNESEASNEVSKTIP